MGCPIRTSTDHRSFAPPRCLTQLTTSFVASGSQGIPHTLLFRFHLFIQSLNYIKRSFSADRVSRSHALVLARFFTSLCFSSLLLYFPSLVNELFYNHESCINNMAYITYTIYATTFNYNLFNELFALWRISDSNR